jgi:hypothetical protein
VHTTPVAAPPVDASSEPEGGVVVRRTNLAVWLVLAAVASATFAFRAWGPRPGCTILGATLVALAVARIVGPEPGLPGVAVRSRTLDVVGYLVIATAILVLAWTAQSLAG